MEKMQIDEGNQAAKEYLDLSLSKRIVIKSQEDFEREQETAINERQEVLKLVVENYA